MFDSVKALVHLIQALVGIIDSNMHMCHLNVQVRDVFLHMRDVGFDVGHAIFDFSQTQLKSPERGLKLFEMLKHQVLNGGCAHEGVIQVQCRWGRSDA